MFSLAAMRKIDDDGVTFKSHIDGSTHRFTPESSIAIQENLGADIIMAFDECAPPYDRAEIERAMQRTHAWAERCLRAHTRPDQALFGIVQGGVFPELRARSAEIHRQPGLARSRHRRAFGGRDQGRDARHAGSGQRHPARRQAALPDGCGRATKTW